MSSNFEVDGVGRSRGLRAPPLLVEYMDERTAASDTSSARSRRVVEPGNLDVHEASAWMPKSRSESKERSAAAPYGLNEWLSKDTA